MDKNLCAQTPPMGWNSWDCYGASVNEEQLLANARYMAENLKEYGWEYVVCDIQWSEPKAVSQAYNQFTELCMDEFSRLIPAENRFPSSAEGKGFRPIADEIHAMGLKFGIHIMRGIPRQAVHRNTAIKGSSATARQIAKPYSICPWNTDMYGVDCNRDGAQEYMSRWTISAPRISTRRGRTTRPTRLRQSAGRLTTAADRWCSVSLPGPPM